LRPAGVMSLREIAKRDLSDMKCCQNKLLRLPEVKQTTGLSKSTIYTRIAEGTFPKQIPLGPRLVVLVESEI
jgi:prophage regulatory protein